MGGKWQNLILLDYGPKSLSDSTCIQLNVCDCVAPHVHVSLAMDRERETWTSCWIDVGTSFWIDVQAPLLMIQLSNDAVI